MRRMKGMSTKNEVPRDSVKVITMLKLDNGSVVDAEELTAEQREAYIEFAIHLAAPQIARFLSGTLPGSTRDISPESQAINEEFFSYPAMMNVKQAAEMLNIGEATVREMERRWQGKFFPAIRMGNRIRIPRDELIQWIKEGGISKYREEIKVADAEYDEQKRRLYQPSYGRKRSIAPKIK